MWISGGGMVSLGVLPGGGDSGAAGVSSNGLVIVGNSSSSLAPSEAFRWTSGTGMVGLGLLPGGSTSQGNGVSGDGSVVVGYGMNSSHVNEAWEWISGGGMVGLGFVPGLSVSSALAADGNGSEIVGWGNDGGSIYQASIWDSANGMRSLQGVLTNSYGLNLTGWTLQEATSVSADGNTITGYGIDPRGNIEAWVVQIPEPSTILLTGTGLLGTMIASRRRR
jgi:probable HAF family extracellular repeat protein